MMDIETQIEVAQQWANTCRVAGNSFIADGFDRAAAGLIAAKGSIVVLEALKDDFESELTTLRAELDNIKTSWALLHTENEQLRQRIANAEGQEPAIRIGKGGNQININPDYTGPIHGEFYARPIPQVTDHVEIMLNMVPRITEQDAREICRALCNYQNDDSAFLSDFEWNAPEWVAIKRTLLNKLNADREQTMENSNE